MKPAYEYGDEVRLIRNVRNDGTYPGKEVGQLLMKRGAIGCVYDVGTYLQDQLIYRVHFLDSGKTVGCREEELIPADAPWIDNRYEFRDRVISRISLAVQGNVVVEAGSEGEIERVLRDETAITYHVRFSGRTFSVPESALADRPETAEGTEPTAATAAGGDSA
ncbi:MAG: nitrogen fixation protein NifZ [Oceanospirillaceae bacterium]|nr:nitrogen fixation protein NifZ [Oceanospirillaceae bacterium]|tara:strand:- start:1930 stop:2421 length:492 start_codon:yes stop_codon:yes gene_type:complete